MKSSARSKHNGSTDASGRPLNAPDLTYNDEALSIEVNPGIVPGGQNYAQRGLQQSSHPPEVMEDDNTRIERQYFMYDQELGRSSRNSPDHAQTDEQGHYVGPSSGDSFLSRALSKLHANISSTSKSQGLSIFNFMDAPLPPFDPYFLILPTREEARALIRRCFDFAFPTHRFLHQPTVETWCEEFYDEIQRPKQIEPGRREIRALLLMVLAQAKQYELTQERQKEDSSSIVNRFVYFTMLGQKLIEAVVLLISAPRSITCLLRLVAFA